MRKYRHIKANVGKLAVPKILAVTALALLSAVGSALADPVGKYSVKGVAPGSGEPYEGVVEVTKSGERYQVEWSIGDLKRTGFALGGAVSEGAFVIGPAHPDDLMLAIGYSDSAGFGTVTMFLQPDGHFEGFLVDSTEETAGQEVWTAIAN